mgnify:CR=1 FL=1
MSEEIPLKPMGKEDIRKLELALILGTLFREDVIEKIRSATDRVTWLDSLVVAAGALARERAGYDVSRIAEELGRSEHTIRNHLAKKTEAGELVADTYERIRSSGGRLELPMISLAPRELQELRKRVEELEKQNKELLEKLSRVKSSLEQILREL